MFYHGFGFGPHIGFFLGGPSFIIMFILFMFLLSALRRSFYGGYRGYRGYRHYQRPYRPYDANPYQGNQPQGSETDNTETPRNETRYYGYGDAPGQGDQGAQTVRTDTSAQPDAASEAGTPTTRVDNAPGRSREPTRPL